MEKSGTVVSGKVIGRADLSWDRIGMKVFVEKVSAWCWFSFQSAALACLGTPWEMDRCCGFVDVACCSMSCFLPYFEGVNQKIHFIQKEHRSFFTPERHDSGPWLTLDIRMARNARQRFCLYKRGKASQIISEALLFNA